MCWATVLLTIPATRVEPLDCPHCLTPRSVERVGVQWVCWCCGKAWRA